MSNFIKNPLFAFMQMLLVFVFSVTLISCSSSSGGGAVTTVSGTVATGVAFDGTVSVYGAGGGEIIDIPIDASGNYSVDVSGLTAPFYFCALPTNPATQDPLYSLANAGGTTNITPLTTLTLFIANGEQDPGPLATSSAWPIEAANIQAALADAQATVNANFINEFPGQSGIDFASYDFFSSTFSIGDLIDQILDLLDITISGNTATIMTNGGVFSFNFGIDFSGINIGGTGGTGGTGTGTLTFSGAGAALLPASSVNFSPTIAQSAVTGALWQDGNATTITLSVDPSNPSQVITIGAGIPDGTAWALVNLTSIQGATFDGTTATFVGITLTSGAAPPLVLNGSLSL